MTTSNDTPTIPASAAPCADTIPTAAIITPLVRAGLDNGVELADLDAWRCPGGDDARRAREVERFR